MIKKPEIGTVFEAARTLTRKLLLRCESCTACGYNEPMSIDAKQVVPNVTGMATVVDCHGIQDPKKPHARLLYVDAHGSVRSFLVVEAITGLPEKK